MYYTHISRLFLNARRSSSRLQSDRAHSASRLCDHGAASDGPVLLHSLRRGHASSPTTSASCSTSSRNLPHEHRAYSGECHPSLDVLETDEAVEVVVDVAGVPAEALRVLFRGGVAADRRRESAAAGTANPTFHLVEREFGRFARAVRLNGAFDMPERHARHCATAS